MFNKKYGLSINIEDEIINLSNIEYILSDNFLNDFGNIIFPNVYKLIIRVKNINTNNFIINMPKLSELDMSNCFLDNINFLDKDCFQNIKKLYLNNNNIEDLSIFKNKLINLIELYIANNKINSVEYLINHKNLKKIDITGNLIIYN